MPYGLQVEDFTNTYNEQQLTEQAYEADKKAFLQQLYRGKEPVYEIDIELHDLTDPAAERNKIIQKQMFYKQLAVLLGVYNPNNQHSGFVSLAASLGIAKHNLLLAPLEFFDKIVNTPSIFLAGISTAEQQQVAKKNLISIKSALEEIFYLLKKSIGLDRQRQTYFLEQLLRQLGQCLPGVQSTCTLLLVDLKIPGIKEQVDIFRSDMLSKFHAQCIDTRSQDISQANLRRLNANSIHLLNNIITEAATFGFIINRQVANYNDMFGNALPLTEQEKKDLRQFILKEYTLENLVRKNVCAFKTDLKQTCKELKRSIAPNDTLSYNDYELMKEEILELLKRYGMVNPGIADIPQEIAYHYDFYIDELLEFKVMHIKGPRPAYMQEKHLYVCGRETKIALFNIDGKSYSCPITTNVPPPYNFVPIDCATEIAKQIAKVKFVNLERALIKNLSSINACSLHPQGTQDAAEDGAVEVIAYAEHKCTVAFMQGNTPLDLAAASSDTRKAAIDKLDSNSFLIFLAHELSKGNIALLNDFITHGRHKIDEWAWQSMYAIVIKSLTGENQSLALEVLLVNNVSFFMQEAAQHLQSSKFMYAYGCDNIPDLKDVISKVLLDNDTALKDQVYRLASGNPAILNVFIKDYIRSIIQPRHRILLYNIFISLLKLTDRFAEKPQYLKDTYMSLLLMIWRNIPSEYKVACIKDYASLSISQGMFNLEFLRTILDINQSQALLVLSFLLSNKDSLPLMHTDNVDAIVTDCLYENKTPLYYAIEYALPNRHAQRDYNKSIPALSILALGSTRLDRAGNMHKSDYILENPIQLALYLERPDIAENIFRFAYNPEHEFYRFYTNFHNSRSIAVASFLRNENLAALDFMLQHGFIEHSYLARAAHAENKTRFCSISGLLSDQQIEDAIPPPPPRVNPQAHVPVFHQHRANDRHRNQQPAEHRNEGHKKRRRLG